MSFRLKQGVNPIGIKNEMILGNQIVEGVYADWGYECVATSINDSDHDEVSRHYQGMAIDYRVRHLIEKHKQEIEDEIKRRLGRHYKVIRKPLYIHVSYKPRKP